MAVSVEKSDSAIYLIAHRQRTGSRRSSLFAPILVPAAFVTNQL